MDIQRPQNARRKLIKRLVYGAVLLALIASISLGLSRLRPAAPTVEAATVWKDSVKRGPMLRQVRGLGTLVPEEIRFIPATNQGRVERIVVRPGAQVSPETILVELSNPELQQSLVDSELQLRASEADLANLRVQLESQFLNQRAAAAAVTADFNQAKLRAEANEELLKDGLIAQLEVKVSRVRSDELGSRNLLEQQRLQMVERSTKSQIDAQQARADQFRAIHQLRRQQVDLLRVRAGLTGVLQELPLQVGQQVSAGTTLAKVVQPEKLKAELKIEQTQAKDIQIGQVASIDTRNGIVPGHVVRIDPSVQGGTVTVDVALDSDLPRGARPDLSVDGTIEIERLNDVLYVGRPAFGQERSRVGLFKLETDGQEAVRVQVQLGRSSVNTIEIIEGLKEGDTVILSDMSAWDAFDRVRLR